MDGQDNPYTTVAAMRFDEVQKYITPIHYLFSLEPLIVSEAVFRKQSPEVQQALLDAGREATAHSFRYLQETEHKVRDQLQARGMQIVQPADGERKWIELGTEPGLAKVLRRRGRPGTGGSHPACIGTVNPGLLARVREVVMDGFASSSSHDTSHQPV